MRNIVSPLDGFLSPFGLRSGVSIYAILGLDPPLVLDFNETYYRTGGTATDLAGAVTHSRSGSATYVDATGTIQTAADGVPRIGHHVWNGSSWVDEGYFHESESRVQLLHTTDALVTQSYTVTAVPHTLHFTGTGTVTLSGASTAGPLVGTGAGEQNRVSLTFTPTAASLTLTVSGTVTNAQLEVGSTPSSYIPNLASSGTVTRAADTLTIPTANLPWSGTAVSIQMGGRMTYVDDGTSSAMFSWNAGTGRANMFFNYTGALTGMAQAFVRGDGGSNVSALGDVSAQVNPGVFSPFNFALRVINTEAQIAGLGAAGSIVSNPDILADLSGTDATIGDGLMGTIKLLRIWADDITEAGIEEASA